MLRWLIPRRFLAPNPIDSVLWQRVLRQSPLLRTLDSNQQARLQQLSAWFLQRKTLTPIHGLRLSPWRCTVLAAHCCLPALQLGQHWLQGWQELIIYPGEFRVRRHEQDDHGVVHEWDDELAGEAWEQGPVVLSWADVLTDLRWPQPGYNVILHEIAHKLDARDGAIDGVPPLPNAWRRRWIADFQAAFEQLEQQLAQGDELRIDPYAAESAEEFFAVCSEYHFTAAELLRQQCPAVAAHLQHFYAGLDAPA